MWRGAGGLVGGGDGLGLGERGVGKGLSTYRARWASLLRAGYWRDCFEGCRRDEWTEWSSHGRRGDQLVVAVAGRADAIAAADDEVLSQ